MSCKERVCPFLRAFRFFVVLFSSELAKENGGLGATNGWGSVLCEGSAPFYQNMKDTPRCPHKSRHGTYRDSGKTFVCLGDPCAELVFGFGRVPFSRLVERQDKRRATIGVHPKPLTFLGEMNPKCRKQGYTLLGNKRHWGASLTLPFWGKLIPHACNKDTQFLGRGTHQGEAGHRLRGPIPGAGPLLGVT